MRNCVRLIIYNNLLEQSGGKGQIIITLPSVSQSVSLSVCLSLALPCAFTMPRVGISDREREGEGDIFKVSSPMAIYERGGSPG